MKQFCIETFGCKVNQYESQQIREILQGYQMTEDKLTESTDLAFVNTCCVTNAASSKSKQFVRRILNKAPGATVVVTGCLPSVEEPDKSFDGQVVWVGHNDGLEQKLISILEEKNASGQEDQASVCTSGVTETNQPIQSFNGHTRAFLKIQDGCDGHCTYCIIPQTRAVLSSKPIADVVEEAKRLVDGGHKEIVLTGIFIGAFGQESVIRSRWEGRKNHQLAQLLYELVKVDGLERVRMSSVEPADITQDLVDVYCDYPETLMPHFHLCLQSGSDAILKRMARQYRRDEFLETAAMIKSRLDRPALTTDVIVGFPGETDEDFEDTVNLAKEVHFSKMHIFPFSLRQGTSAEKLKDHLGSQTIKDRCNQLGQLDRELTQNYQEQFVGETATLLVEKATDQQISGRNERYFKILCDQPEVAIQKNDLVEVQLNENHSQGLVGQVLESISC